MFKSRLFRSKPLALSLAGAFLLLLLPCEGLSEGTGSLEGIILDQEMRLPVSNAVVKIRNLESEKEFASGPTDENGEYRIEAVDEGDYILGIVAEDGSYNFDFVVSIREGETAKLTMAIKPGQEEEEEEEEERGILAFFSSPTGIILLVMAAGLIAFGTWKLLEGKEEPVSPAIKKK